MKFNKKSIFYSASVLAISNIILQAIGFVYRIFLTDLTGTEGLGIYKLVMQFYFVILAVSTSGANLVSTTRSASLYGLGEIGKLRKTLRSCFSLFLMILSGCLVCVLFFDDFIATTLLGDIQTKPSLYIALVCILLTGIENIIKNSLIGIRKVKYAAVSEIVEQLLRVTLVLGLLYFFSHGDYGRIAFLILLGMTLSEIFSVLFLGKIYIKVYKTKTKYNKPIFKDVCKVAIPISLAAVFTNIISSASTLILPARLIKAGFTREEALSELGIISGIAMPMLILPIAIISSYCLVIMPTISKSKASGDTAQIRRKINKSFEATGLIGVPLTCLLVFLAKPFGRVLFSVNFDDTYIILIGVSVILLYYQIVSSNILNGLGLERKVVSHNVFGEIVQLVVTFLLCSIPHINIYGYIIGMIVSPLIVVSLNCSYIFADYKFNFIKFVAKPLFCGAFLYIASDYMYNFIIGIVGSQVISSIWICFLGAIIYMIILRSFGIDYIKYIKNLEVRENMKYKLK